MRRSSSLTEARSRSPLPPIGAGWPLTVTRPSRISSSPFRREAMPARARIFCSRSSLIGLALGVAVPWTSWTAGRQSVSGATPLVSPFHLGPGRGRLFLANRTLVLLGRLPIGLEPRARDPLRLPGGFVAFPILQGFHRLLARVELRRLAQDAFLAVVQVSIGVDRRYRRDRRDRAGRRRRRDRANRRRRRGRSAEGFLELLERRQIAQSVETEVHQELARGGGGEGFAHPPLAPRDAHQPLLEQGLEHPHRIDAAQLRSEEHTS